MQKDYYDEEIDFHEDYVKNTLKFRIFEKIY